uniref:Uncharacterized protein n=1 Tax=Balaenoptera musculus TaxID=9771 RepID=A0A8C0CBQ4_BALMU
TECLYLNYIEGSSVLCFYIHGISFHIFIIQGLMSYNVSCSRIQREHVPGDLCIDAFILISSAHPQHEGTLGHIFPKADLVHILAEHRGIIVGIHHQDSDLNGAASRRIPAV